MKNQKILYNRRFVKHFAKRIKVNSKLEKRFLQRVSLFLENPLHPLLKNHSLEGEMKGAFAFSITGDYRVIYKKEGDAIRFVDIGTHAQVYE